MGPHGQQRQQVGHTDHAVAVEVGRALAGIGHARLTVASVVARLTR